MDRYYGFDLGDAESAVSCLNKNDAGVPRIITVGEAGSFVTAYARLRNGALVIGEAACYNPEAVERKIRFKSRFLRDPDSRRDVKSFAAGVLGELYMSGDLVKGEDCCFYVGCPAGWDKTARERYRGLFEEAGYPPVRIISESRAALVSACQSKHFQVGYDILSKPVLVVDVGSSTTDFAYIMGGKEVDMQTAGEVALGGGIMDEVLLSCALNASVRGERMRSSSRARPGRATVSSRRESSKRNILPTRSTGKTTSACSRSSSAMKSRSGSSLSWTPKQRITFCTTGSLSWRAEVSRMCSCTASNRCGRGSRETSLSSYSLREAYQSFRLSGTGAGKLSPKLW